MAELTKIATNFSQNTGMDYLAGSINALKIQIAGISPTGRGTSADGSGSTWMNNFGGPIETLASLFNETHPMVVKPIATGEEYDITGQQGNGFIASKNAYMGSGSIGDGSGKYGTEGTGFDASQFGGMGSGLVDLMSALDPVVNMFGSMFTSLSSVVQIMNPIQTVLASMFEVLGPLIDQLLAPIVGVLKIFGQILAAVLIPVLNILTPIINAIATAFVWFLNHVIIPVGNLIIDIFNGVIWALNKIPFVNIAYADKLSTVSLDDAAAAGTASSSGSSSGSGAAYTGKQPITFNFYNEGNVVGTGGLRELAYLLKDIIDTDARYA